MTLEQIHYFLALAKYKNFTRAAEALYISQPTISKQILQLEKELGTQLFIRTKEGVKLTHTGSLIHDDLQNAYQCIGNAVNKATKHATPIEGTLSIGIGHMFDMNSVLPGFLAKFNQLYPGIKLHFSSSSFSEMQQRLDGGEFDLIFTYSLEPEKIQFQKRMAVSRSHTYLYYPNSMAPHPDVTLTIENFLDCPLLRLKRSSSNFFLSSMTHLLSRPFASIIEVPNMETLILYLESGIGVCIMGKSYRIGSRDTISTLDLTAEEKFPCVGTDAVWLKCNQSISLKLFLSTLSEYIKNASMS